MYDYLTVTIVIVSRYVWPYLRNMFNLFTVLEIHGSPIGYDNKQILVGPLNLYSWAIKLRGSHRETITTKAECTTGSFILSQTKDFQTL